MDKKTIEEIIKGLDYSQEELDIILKSSQNILEMSKIPLDKIIAIAEVIKQYTFLLEHTNSHKLKVLNTLINKELREVS